jgi:hypothetical protein
MRIEDIQSQPKRLAIGSSLCKHDDGGVDRIIPFELLKSKLAYRGIATVIAVVYQIGEILCDRRSVRDDFK